MLYLQYSFAGSHYRKCCGKLDVCCTRLLSMNMSRVIMKSHYAVLNQNVNDICEVAIRSGTSDTESAGEEESVALSRDTMNEEVESSTKMVSDMDESALLNAEIQRMISVIDYL